MRKFFVLLLLLLVASPDLAEAQWGPDALGIRLDVSRRFVFTDCAAGGSASQTVTEGTYIARFLTEDIWICYAATCAANGEKFGAGTVMMLYIPAGGQVVSCRSAGATGDFVLTGATQ